MGKHIIFRIDINKAGEPYVNIIASNGQVLFTSEGYSSGYRGAVNVINMVTNAIGEDAWKVVFVNEGRGN